MKIMMMMMMMMMMMLITVITPISLADCNEPSIWPVHPCNWPKLALDRELWREVASRC